MKSPVLAAPLLALAAAVILAAAPQASAAPEEDPVGIDELVGMTTPREQDYLYKVEEKIPYVFEKYGAIPFMAMGRMVCEKTSEGWSDMELVQTISEADEYSMSTTAASWVVTLAHSRLGC